MAKRMKANKRKQQKSVKVENKKLNRLVKRGKVKLKSSSPYVKSRKSEKRQQKFNSHFNRNERDESNAVDEQIQAEDVMDMLPKRELMKIWGPKRKWDENDDDASDADTLSKREQQVQKMKESVGNLATTIINHPEKNIKRLKELILLLDFKADSNAFKLSFITIQRLIAFATLEVFKDIIPNYRVVESEKRGKDDKRKLKKETKLLWDYERTLVQLYKLYIRRLERMVECIRKKSSAKSNFYFEIVPNRKALIKIATVGLKCLSELLLTHPHFNHRNTIIASIVSLAVCTKSEEISDLACETLSKLYKQDKAGDVSLEAVKATAKAIKSSAFNVDPKVLRTFLSLKIKEIKKKGAETRKDMKLVRGKLEKMSRKERKRNKEMHKLENQLLETEATENQKKKIEYHTEILNQIFYTYFRILKFNLANVDDETIKAKFKLALTPVLEGLSKFAHLINIEFFDNIIAVLHGLMKEDLLDSHQSFHCLKTVFIILTGEGSALNIDPQRFYTMLYNHITFVSFETEEETIVTMFECVDSMIVKRRKQISLKRVLAFIKRLATVALNNKRSTSLAILSLIARIMQNHKQSDILIDTDKCGNGVYLPEAEDPEFSNANASTLWELHLLRNHYQKSIRNYSAYIMNGLKNNSLVNKTPIEIFDSLKSIDLLPNL
ncbi:nucleolar complex protein 3-like protein [Dinothrombium tinctorium]|uniref:NOC3-like protein n=1 Tax=Dinothrombium tinctorium TaxID=1965070 RepID=A0A443QV95_9ACAR|nr:nucleolar complex protein 3-like protein [Dinothrombium tinctorium]RWS06933.1 nucleolar complex protein 3-like protein [Dinothrombium tinctorium]